MNDKVNITTDNGNDLSRINEAVSRRIKQFRREKKILSTSFPVAPASVKGCWWISKGCRGESQYRTVVQKSLRRWGVSVAEFVNVASEPMVHLIDRDAIPVLWRGEQGR